MERQNRSNWWNLRKLASKECEWQGGGGIHIEERIFLGGKFVFHLGRIESLAGKERLIAPSARRKRSDILSRRFQRCIDPCKIHGNSSTGSFHDTFRTGRGTSSMILGDLRSPNRSQIAFALVLMAGARVSRSTLDAYSIPLCRSFDIIQMERAVPFPYYYRVIIIVWKLFQIRVYKSFEIYRTFKQVYERNRKFLSFRVLTKYLREFSKIISNL